MPEPVKKNVESATPILAKPKILNPLTGKETVSDQKGRLMALFGGFEDSKTDDDALVLEEATVDMLEMKAMKGAREQESRSIHSFISNSSWATQNIQAQKSGSSKSKKSGDSLSLASKSKETLPDIVSGAMLSSVDLASVKEAWNEVAESEEKHARGAEKTFSERSAPSFGALTPRDEPVGSPSSSAESRADRPQTAPTSSTPEPPQVRCKFQHR